MKTENTPENKAAFFAQYWAQQICEYRFVMNAFDFVKTDTLIKSGTPIDNWSLYLTPLSSITDEDAVEVDKICRFSYSKFPEFIGKEIRNWLIFNGTGLGNTSHKWDFLKAADYLRSRGYLIQWRDLTPDQLISYGWVKVKMI